jgi:large subunit ribosomal protein L35
MAAEGTPRRSTFARPRPLRCAPLSRINPPFKNRPAVRAAVAVLFAHSDANGTLSRDIPIGRQAQESQMPKLKTKSGAKKRFKITGTGKVVYAQRGKRHGMIKRTPKQIRKLRGTAILFKTDGDNVKKFFLPNG